MKIIKYEFLVRYEFFVKYENFVLDQKIHTLPKYSYFTEIFVLDEKF